MVKVVSRHFDSPLSGRFRLRCLARLHSPPMFWKRKQQAQDEHTVTISSPPTNPTLLPDELLLEIFQSYRSEARFLVKLSQVCRFFLCIAELWLYESIHIDVERCPPLYRPAVMRLSSSLTVPRIARVVTVLHIYLANWLLCPQRIIDAKLIEPGEEKMCRCDELDEALGRALVALDQLQSLRLYCNLCYDPRTSKRHQHLARLGSRRLKEFVFRCNCVILCKWNSSEILLQESMNTVEALSLEWSLRVSVPFPLRAFERAGERLKNISTLNYNLEPHCKQLLETRDITRIAASAGGSLEFGSKFDVLHDQLSKYGRCLTHLYIGDVGRWLQRPLTLEVKPYENLQVLGVLLVPVWQGDVMLHALEILSPLKSLRQLEFLGQVALTLLPVEVPQVLVERHPQLCKIYLQFSIWRPQAGAREVIWERGEDSNWISRNVDTIHWWDILTGIR